jgi:hypothetical protein
MGLAANQARLLGLIARKSDLELEAQFISQHRMYLSNMMSGLLNLQTKLEPDTAPYKLFEARIGALQQADKMLEMQLNRINTQREAVGKEMDSVQKIIAKNIQGSFGLLGR